MRKRKKVLRRQRTSSFLRPSSLRDVRSLTVASRFPLRRSVASSCHSVSMTWLETRFWQRGRRVESRAAESWTRRGIT